MNSPERQAQEDEQQAQNEPDPEAEQEAPIGSSPSSPNFDADTKLKEVQKVFVSLESKIDSIDSKAVSLDSKVNRIMDAQTFMNLDFGLYKRAFYKNIDTMVANVTSSQTVLETSLVHQFTEMQISSDLDVVKMQLAKMVKHLKELGDAKRGEGPSKGPSMSIEKIRLL
ncbi:zinc finger BED domain-containing protein RICESLEEPER 2-like [Dorcoceras hygrometricum]|uniref:Zinc finger BED domain-containing protein RICESLEEPER 2-like n=1 Tax=Dorcoceras hygrometricum TaxID=472368 RepID=A0A2Z7BQ74_9LAMI|nr:zinc finger BED domain-containing protein RICESLEEPER 2-like [Dorcoceras hygrometricum]